MRGAAIALVLAACGPGKADPDETTGDGSTADATEVHDTGQNPTEVNDTGGTACVLASTTELDPTGEPTTGGPGECPVIMGKPCTAAIDCVDEPCGSHISAFDEHGCPRQDCNGDDDCAAGDRCLHATSDGSAFPEVQCTGTPDACTCTRTHSEVLGVCMPAQIMPDQLLAFCDTITRPDLCARFDVAAFSYCRWLPVQVFCPGRCEVGAQQGACVGFRYAGEGCGGSCTIDGGQGYTRAEPGPARLLINHECGDEPFGWQRCGVEGERPACCMCGVE